MQGNGSASAERRPWSWALALSRISESNPARWQAEITSLQAQYESFVHEFLGSEHARDLRSLSRKTSSRPAAPAPEARAVQHNDHPLAADSKREQLAQLEESVAQDVERLQPSHPLFDGPLHSNSLKAGALRAVMLHFVLSGCACSYVQGVHELAGVLLFSWAHEACIEPADAEAMAFFCLIDIRAELSHLGGGQELQEFAEGVMTILRRADMVLWKHMRSLFPQCESLVLVRWVSVLFCHEFDLEGVMQLWDCFLSQSITTAERALQAACAAMLLVARSELLSCESDAEALHSVLNRYPEGKGASDVASEARSLMHALG